MSVDQFSSAVNHGTVFTRRINMSPLHAPFLESNNGVIRYKRHQSRDPL